SSSASGTHRDGGRGDQDAALAQAARPALDRRGRAVSALRRAARRGLAGRPRRALVAHFPHQRPRNARPLRPLQPREIEQDRGVPVTGFNRDALRPGQRDALEAIVARYRAEIPYTAIVLPTRYGKSDVMRVAAWALWQDGSMPCALALSPNVVLRD